MDTYKKTKTLKKQGKDSLFTNMFKEPRYARQLVETLHPEFKNIAEDDLKIISLRPVIVNDLYNDLAVECFGKLMIFVEQQSTYNPNIALRMLIYAASTLNGYLEVHDELNTYSTRKMEMPETELYCICAYEKKETYPDTEIFGTAGKGVCSCVKMIYPKDVEEGIISQYMVFAKKYTEILKASLGKEEKLEQLQQLLEWCIENNILSDYLKNHKVEATDIMDSIFDEEVILRKIKYEERQLGKAEGIVEGKTQGKAEGKIEARVENYAMVTRLIMDKQSMSFEKAAEFLEIPENLIDEIRKKIETE